MSETNLQLSINVKMDFSHAAVKIVCSPNSLEALTKRGGLNAQFVPLSVLGSFALQHKIGGGEIVSNQRGFEEKTTGAQ